MPNQKKQISINISVYIGADQATGCAYEASNATFVAYKQHKDTSVQMRIHIFGDAVFLNLHEQCTPAPGCTISIGAPCVSPDNIYY